jgi:catechol 2,3-dioxygenase-like lactoylglutathione lyase family enzyme
MDVERANTILYCERWNEVVEFYRDRLGLEVVYENDWFVELRLGRGSFVSVADASRSSIPPGSGAGLTLSWQVADVDRARTQLLDAGVDVGVLGTRWGARVLDLVDPAGNRVELWSQPAPS